MYFKNTVYRIESISSKEVVLHHHLGLGDAIICNGIVNYLTKQSIRVNLPVLKENFHQISFMYQENNLVSLFCIKNDSDVYKKPRSKQILRVGFEKNFGMFNTSFYEQLNLPYSHSVKYFYLPQDIKKQLSLQKYLFESYNVEKEFILVHRTSSYGSVDLNIKSNLPIIYVEKDTDIHKNIFLYKGLIESAKEIHCLDSSFLHLVERVQTDAKLYFHNIKNNTQASEKLKLIKNWTIII